MSNEINKTLIYNYYDLVLKYLSLANAYLDIMEDRKHIKEILDTLERLSQEQLTNDFITFTEL